MNKKYTFFLACSFCSLLLFSCKKEENLSKGFIKYFGGIEVDDASEVQQTSDGGYVIIGTTSSSGSGGSDMYVIKTDASGNKQWEKTFGGTLNDEGSSVQQTSDGGYIFLGTYRYTSPGLDSNKTDFYLIKANVNGDTLWTRKYGYSGVNEGGISVKQNSDGSYVVIGNTEQFGGDINLFTVNSTGVIEQPAPIPQYPGNPAEATLFDRAVNVIEYTPGKYVTSILQGTPGKGPTIAFFRKNNQFSSSPNPVGKDDVFETSMNIPGEVALGNDPDSYVMTGTTDVNDLFLIKIEGQLSSSKKWFKTFGSGGIDEGVSVQAAWADNSTTITSGYVVLGSTNSSGAGSKDIYLIKTNESGDQEWFKNFGGPGSDIGKMVRRTSDGGYIILATMEFGDDPSSKDNIICLIKVNSKGEVEN